MKQVMRHQIFNHQHLRERRGRWKELERKKKKLERERGGKISGKSEKEL